MTSKKSNKKRPLVLPCFYLACSGLHGVVVSADWTWWMHSSDLELRPRG